MRVIIYTGKGGVGKTSAAAASACRIARTGKRVLIMSTDQAHSLGDSFDRKLGREPVNIMDNLDALEIDTIYEGEKSWGSIKNYFKELLTTKVNGGIEVEELLVFPGLEELFSLFKILDFSESGEYDTLVIDCAPTGETLSLLKYPEKLSDFMEKVLPIKRVGMKVAGPVVEKLMKIPMPEDSLFDDVEKLMDKMKRLQELMLNKEIVSLRIVTTPEKIVIREAKRNFTWLYLYNYNVDAVIINRIYPARAMKGYFDKWMEMQAEGMKDIEESFSEVPKFRLELQEEEVRTLPVLIRIGEELFQNTDIDKVLFNRQIYELFREDEEIVLKILLPFADKGELEMKQNGQELAIGVRNETRRFLLPQEAQDKEIVKAQFEEGYLFVRFKKNNCKNA